MFFTARLPGRGFTDPIPGIEQWLVNFRISVQDDKDEVSDRSEGEPAQVFVRFGVELSFPLDISFGNFF